jgi:hypothetical protein
MMVSNGVCLWWCMSLVMTVVVYVSVGDCGGDSLVVTVRMMVSGGVCLWQ